MRLHRPSLVAATLLAATVLVACGDDDDSTADTGTDTSAETTPDATSAPTGEPAAVTMERSRFMPDEVTVGAGAEVSWENTDRFAHTVTAAEGSAVDFDSGELAGGDTFTQTFDEAGTYDYFCEIHPTMRATVVVE